jgi:ATP-dependent Clp protease ATP-binding subunit ClpA
LKPNTDLEKLIESANKIASTRSSRYVTTEHLLYAILLEEDFKDVLTDFSIQVEELTEEVQNYIDNKITKETAFTGSPTRTHALERVFNRSYTQVMFSGRDKLLVFDIFISMMSETNTHCAYFLTKYGIKKEDFAKFITQKI